MLVLSRKVGEQIIIDGDIRVSVVHVRGNRVRIGIQAPPDARIRREELASTAVGSAGDSATCLDSSIGCRD
jgi:carbon storage regulator